MSYACRRRGNVAKESEQKREEQDGDKGDEEKSGQTGAAVAKLPGRRYEEDKPRDCRYCYYWAGRVRGCSRKDCWYLLPLPEKPKKEFDENGVPVLNCRTCAYAKQGPCIGYCIAKIEREVFSKTRGWKLPADPPAEPAPDRDPGSIPASVCGVMT